MLILWHGASEVIGGLLCIITLAPNVVNRLTWCTIYTLYQVLDFMGMDWKSFPEKCPYVARTCPSALKKSKAPSH